VNNRIINNIIDGARSVLVIFYHDDYVRPSRGEFARDIKNLSGDVRNIGKDMHKAIAKRKV
jgi:hypothetical protein